MREMIKKLKKKRAMVPLEDLDFLLDWADAGIVAFGSTPETVSRFNAIDAKYGEK